MKKVLQGIILLTFCLLAIQANAKTVYYVKSGATGNGSSWSNASGSIQDMIDRASPGDEVWIAGGTYVTPAVDIYTNASWFYYFTLKSGVSIYGGFKGVESDLQQREKKDRNRNGKIEPWEFANETILSGYYADEERQWKIDDENNVLEIVSDTENSSYHILYYPEEKTVSSYPYETYISGFTITGGKSACVIENSDCFIISDCEVCYNDGYGILQFNAYGILDSSKSCIKNSSIHHNIGKVAYIGNSIENTIFRHNHTKGSELIDAFKSIDNCKIYANVSEEYQLFISVDICDYSEIYNNITGYGINCNTMNNSKVYNNNVGNVGASVGKAYDCKFYQNSSSGVWVSDELYNCEIYQNGGGISGYEATIKDCKIYQNKEMGIYGGILYNCNVYNNQGCGIDNATAFNCHIYGNEGGGTNSSSLYDCIIENNTTEGGGGGTGDGSLHNCIVRNNFAVGDGGGCAGGYLENCKVYNNESLNNGGGVSGGTVWGCSIFNNKAGNEGGGTSSVDYCYNSDIYNNYASTNGGVNSGRYINCTITKNKTFSGSDNSGYLNNSILIGTFEGSASYSAFTDSYIRGDGNFLATEKELNFKKSTSFIGNASNEKQLEELKNADFSLLKGSSAIDMGQQIFNESLPVEDISGYPRPMGEKIDMGAHEYLSFKALPYENKFDENSLSMNIFEKWKNGKLPGKDNYYLYYDGESYSTNTELDYVTTTFFDKTVSNKINLSFDVAAKYKTKDQQEKMHIILAYLDSDKRDTIMTYSNTDYVQELHFSKEISSWVKNKVFRILFAVKETKNGNYYNKNIVYCGITNLNITKQDASVEISAEDKVYAYDGKSHAIDYQINDTRVDKNKVVVTYQKEGETTSVTTPPVNAGIYQVRISIEDGSYFGMKDVKLTIEKANQTIQWTQQLRTIKAKEKMQLEATSTSGLPVSFSSEDETIAKVEAKNGEWWLVADTLPGEVTIKAVQLGNDNYNLANSVLKTIRVEAVPTGISAVATDKVTACFIKAENCISVKNIHPDSQLFLYDSLGHLCVVKDADNIEIQIPVHELSKGIYYLLITRGNDKENFKILIN